MNLKYVILRHDPSPGGPRPPHWDLMLETTDQLRTWALADLPLIDRDIIATPLPDHRVAYLEYQGPVSGNRGSVTQWDAGTYVVQDERPDRMVVVLAGRRGPRRATLWRPPDRPAIWLARFEAV